jgi:ABC-type transporter Mla MlaB component
MKIVNREGENIFVRGEVNLDNLSDFCRSLKNKLKVNDVVSISFESLDSKGSAILPLLIFLRRQERELSATVTFKCCSARVHEMARLAGLSEELGV